MTLGSVPLVSVLRRFDCNTDTSVMQTLVAVPLVSVLKRFDCNTDTSVMRTLGSVPLVSVLRRFDCDTDTSVMQTLRSVPLVSDLRRFDCNIDTSVVQTLGSVPLVSVLRRFIWNFVCRTSLRLQVALIWVYMNARRLWHCTCSATDIPTKFLVTKIAYSSFQIVGISQRDVSRKTRFHAKSWEERQKKKKTIRLS